MWRKCAASVVIDSATYLLTISLPDINNVAMSLYDIKCGSDSYTHSPVLWCIEK